MTPETQTTTEVRNFEHVCEILDRHNRRPEKLIPILQQVQDVYRYLPEDVLAYVATSLGLPPAKVFGVATFYAHFTLQPRGKYVIRLCDGTACHVRGSNGILEALQERLGLTNDKRTTDDMLFTVETVSCLGACGLAPVVLINEDVHGQVTPAAAVKLVDDLIAQEADRDETN